MFAVRAPGRPSTVWLSLKPILDLSALGPPTLRNLDVTVLHGVILGPLLAIDAEALANQSFLTYTHDTAEALARVDSGRGPGGVLHERRPRSSRCWRRARRGPCCPQKSTYFLPKLATGLVMYRLDGAGAAAGARAVTAAGPPGDATRTSPPTRCGRAASGSSSRRAARA